MRHSGHMTSRHIPISWTGISPCVVLWVLLLAVTPLTPTPSAVSSSTRVSSTALLGDAPGAPAGSSTADADHVDAPVDRAWPVGSHPLVLKGWQPPEDTYGRGHRGVDLAATSGAPVRAAAPGRVSFVGRVAGRGVLSIELSGTGDPPLRTTYEPVDPQVAPGDEVTAGQVVGRLATGPFHCPTRCLHWGLLRGETYLNPLSLLPPGLLRRGPSRLLPVYGIP